MNNTPKPAKEKWFINKLNDVISKVGFKKLKISPRTLSFLIALSTYADKKGFCWPLESQLENLCGIRKDNQCKYVKTLKEIGYITVKRKYNRSDKMTRNYYSIHLDAILTISMGLDGDLRVDGIAVRPVMTGAESQWSNIEPTVNSTVDRTVKSTDAIYKTTHTTKLPIKNTQSFTPETNITKNTNPKSILYNVQNKALDVQNFINENEVITMENDLYFNDFWAAYPRKEKKKETHKIWVRDQLDSIAEEIIQDVRLRQVRHAPWLEGRSYIPLPSSYLNGERWQDDLIDVRGSNGGKFNSATHLVDEVRKNYENQNRNNSNIFDATNHFSKKVD